MSAIGVLPDRPDTTTTDDDVIHLVCPECNELPGGVAPFVVTCCQLALDFDGEVFGGEGGTRCETCARLARRHAVECLAWRASHDH